MKFMNALAEEGRGFGGDFLMEGWVIEDSGTGERLRVRRLCSDGRVTGSVIVLDSIVGIL